MKKPLQIMFVAVCCITLNLRVYGQSDIVNVGSTSGHAGTNSAHYVGWDAGTNFDLQVRHDANRRISFHTNSSERMHIMADGTLLSGGGPANIANNGYIGIGTSAIGGNAVPHSMLHIAGPGGNLPFRNWMRYGTLYSTLRNKTFIGVVVNDDNDQITNSVISWGNFHGPDDPDNPGDDNFTFLYTNVYDGSGNGEPGSYHGREMMRITPTAA